MSACEALFRRTSMKRKLSMLDREILHSYCIQIQKHLQISGEIEELTPKVDASEKFETTLEIPTSSPRSSLIDHF